MSFPQTPIIRNVDAKQAPYRGIAFMQMGRLKAFMAKSNLPVFSSRKELENGVVIICKVCYGRESIFINVPDQPKVKTPETAIVYLRPLFHIFADGKPWLIGRYKPRMKKFIKSVKGTQDGKWYKIPAGIYAGSSTALVPWTYRHTWIAAQNKAFITNGGNRDWGFFSRYFVTSKVPMPNPTYVRVGTLQNVSETGVANNANSTKNGKPFSVHRLCAIAFFPNGVAIEVLLINRTLRLTNHVNGYSVDIDLYAKIAACFTYVVPELMYPIETHKYSPDGLKAVGQWTNGATITQPGNPSSKVQKNLGFTFDLSPLAALDFTFKTEEEIASMIAAEMDSLTSDCTTMTDLGEIVEYDTIRNVNIDGLYTVPPTTATLGDLTGVQELFIWERNEIHRSFDYGFDGTLLEIRQTNYINSEIEQVSNAYIAKHGTVKRTLYETQLTLSVNGNIVFSGQKQIFSTLASDIETSTQQNIQDTTYEMTRSYSFTATQQDEPCYEISDFDGRRRILTVREYVQDRNRGGSINAAWGYVNGVLYGDDGDFSEPAIDAAIAGPIVTIITEYVVIDGQIVSQVSTQTSGGVIIPPEEGRSRTDGSVYHSTDRASVAVRSAIASTGDVLVWSPILQGLKEQSPVNFQTYWQDAGKPIFAMLKSDIGNADFSKLEITEIQRIGLCEGYRKNVPITEEV